MLLCQNQVACHLIISPWNRWRRMAQTSTAARVKLVRTWPPRKRRRKTSFYFLHPQLYFFLSFLFLACSGRWLRRPAAALVYISILGAAPASGSFVPRHAAIGGYLFRRGAAPRGQRGRPLSRSPDRTAAARDGRRPPNPTEGRIRYEKQQLDFSFLLAFISWSRVCL